MDAAALPPGNAPLAVARSAAGSRLAGCAQRGKAAPLSGHRVQTAPAAHLAPGDRSTATGAGLMADLSLNPANLNHPPAPQAAAIRAGSAFKTSASFKVFSKDKMTMLRVKGLDRCSSIFPGSAG